MILLASALLFSLTFVVLIIRYIPPFYAWYKLQRAIATELTPTGTPIPVNPLSFYSHTNPYAISTPSSRAYATVLYNEDYVPGALLLGYSLRKHGMMGRGEKMVLLWLEGRLSNDTVKLLEDVGGWECREVKEIPVPEGRPPFWRFVDAYAKLRLFE